MSKSGTGTIVTFYSYKGGTGRTTALANVAWILAQAGFRVLAIDWDLEAPGLHKFFEPFLDPGAIATTPGMIELINDYAWAATSERITARENWHLEYARVQSHAIALNWDFAGEGELHFLSAGRQNRHYSSVIAGMNWDNFYENLGGGDFFAALRDNMKSNYDYVLIDSRTGLTDIADICTVEMPDVLVDCFTLSTQSIEGAAAVARHIDEIYRSRGIRVLPVPMRVEDAENDKVTAGRAMARARFARFPRGMDEAEASQYWLDVEVPYRSFYAFEETLATFGDAPGSHGSLLDAYERLTTVITRGEVAKYTAIPEEKRLATLRAFTRHRSAEITEVTLSYVAADRAWADWIRASLVKRGIRVDAQCADIPPRASSPEDLDVTTVEMSRPSLGPPAPMAILVLISPAYTESDQAGRTWDGLVDITIGLPRQRDILLPIRILDTANLPRKFAGIAPIEIDGLTEQSALDRLLGALGRPGRAVVAGTDDEAHATTGPRYPGAGEAEVWNVGTPNPRFTGRAEVLEGIRNRIIGGSGAVPAAPQVLCGLGGVGKTQIAIEYAWRFRSEYDLVWWISAERPQQVDHAFAELASRMRLDVGPGVPDAAAVAREALRMGTKFPRWLLIYDNATDPAELTPYLPGGTGHVIITSRSSSLAWSGIADATEVGVFSEEESEQLLKTRLQTLTRQQARAIGVELGFLPLAIEQAGAWLQATGVPVREYVGLLDKELTRVLAEASSPDYPGSVATTWNLSFDKLRQSSPSAARVLQLCAFVSPEPIALSLIYSDEMAGLVAHLDDELLESPFARTRLVREITKFALAWVDPSNGTLQVHRLVQAIIRSGMTQEEQDTACRDVHSILVGAMPPGWADLPGNGTDDRKNWELFDRILPHTQASRAVELADETTRQMLITLVRYQWRRNLFEQALDLGEELEDKWPSKVGWDRQYQYLQAQLANVHRSLGHYTEAAVKDEGIYVWQRKYNQDDVYTWITAGGLAADFRALGRFSEALALDERVYRELRRLRGDKHPRTLSAANNLAVSCRLVGEIDRAMSLDQATLSARRKVLGADQPETLHSAACLALDLREKGEFGRSVDMLRETWERSRTVIGEQTLDALRVAKSLSVSLRRGGYREAASNLIQETCTTYDQAFPETPDAWAASIEQASCLSAVGDKNAAKTLATVIFTRQKKDLGEDHPYTLAIATNLCGYLRGTGDAEGAVRLGERTRQKLHAVLGDKHPFVWSCSINVANALADLGRYDQAERIEVETLECLRQHRGRTHPDTLACQSNLSITLAKQGRTQDAEQLRKESAGQLREMLGDEHPWVDAVDNGERLNRDLEPQPI